MTAYDLGRRYFVLKQAQLGKFVPKLFNLAKRTLPAATHGAELVAAKALAVPKALPSIGSHYPDFRHVTDSSMSGRFAVPASERLLDDVIDVGGGLKARLQHTMTGDVSPVTLERGRMMLSLQQGKGGPSSYFYPSLSGASGKQQGHWYPVGGVLSGSKHTPSDWLIKGHVGPGAAPGYGRAGLADLEAAANNTLPHDEAGLNALLSRFSGKRSMDALTPRPTIIDPRLLKPGQDATRLRQEAYDLWKKLNLEPHWGPRTSWTPAP